MNDNDQLASLFVVGSDEFKDPLILPVSGTNDVSDFPISTA